MEELPRLSRAELALLDRLAAEEYGLPVAVLMENAGRSAADEILRLERAGRVVVLAGPGNNGGDAFVVARHLANAGLEVEVFAAAASRGEAAIMRRAVERMGIAVSPVEVESDLLRLEAALARAGIVVDGLLGTGFRGEVRPGIARLIEAVNGARKTSGAIVVALDLPSGLDADTGQAARPTVAADLTVTFAARKLGFDAPEAIARLGRVVVGTIGAPAELVRGVRGRSGIRVSGD